MSDQKCEWKSNYTSDRCGALIRPGDTYCIFHSRDENKDHNEFKKEFERRMRSGGTNFAGGYYPKGFSPNDIFTNQHFGLFVDLREASFAEAVDFSNARFELGVDFRGAKFSKLVHFTRTIFQGRDTNFREAEFNGDVIFSETQFKSQWTSFSSTKFNREVDFDNPTFEKQVYFIKTQFNKCCKVRWAEFVGMDKQVVFENVRLHNCSFLHSNLDKVDFRNCEFGNNELQVKKWWRPWPLYRPSLRKNVLKDEIDVDEGKWNDYRDVGLLYVALKRNVESTKNWDIAGDFHFGEMECRRKFKGIISWETPYCLTSGYEERPLRAAACLLFLVLICAGLYMRYDNSNPVNRIPMVNSSQDAKKSVASDSSTEDVGIETVSNDKMIDSDNNMEVSVSEDGVKKGFSDYVWYSVKAALVQRIGEKEHEPPKWQGKVTLLIESLLSPLLVALFLLAVRRKLKR